MLSQTSSISGRSLAPLSVTLQVRLSADDLLSIFVSDTNNTQSDVIHTTRLLISFTNVFSCKTRFLEILTNAVNAKIDFQSEAVLFNIKLVINCAESVKEFTFDLEDRFSLQQAAKIYRQVFIRGKQSACTVSHNKFIFLWRFSSILILFESCLQ